MSSLRVMQIFPPGWAFHQPEEVFARSPGFETTIVLDSITSLPTDFPRVCAVVRSRYRSLLNTRGIGAGRIVKATDLDSLVRQSGPDMIVSYEAYSSSSFQVAAVKNLVNAKHVVVCYETCPVGKGLWSRFPITAIFAKAVAKTADLFLVHTMKAEKAIRSLGVNDSRIRVLNPGVVTNLKASSRFSERGSHADFVVSYMGPLRANKGIENLIDSYEQFRESKTVPSPSLWIAGDGPLRSLVVDWAKSDSTIRYFGTVKGDDKLKFLHGTDAFVYPSIDQRFLLWTRWEEQLGVSLIEAMSAGCAVIVSDSGALPEVANRPERVFTQGSASSILKHLFELARDRTELAREGLENSGYAQRRFAMCESVTQLSSIIASILTT